MAAASAAATVGRRILVLFRTMVDGVAKLLTFLCVAREKRKTAETLVVTALVVKASYASRAFLESQPVPIPIFDLVEVSTQYHGWLVSV